MTDFIGIDRNVVMPEPGQGSKLKKYPWRTMGIVSGRPPRGDSFLVPCGPRELPQIESSVGSCIRNMRRRHLMHFVMRRVDEGIRVWRIK